MKITTDNYIYYLKSGNEKALEFVINVYGGLLKSIIRKHLTEFQSFQDDCLNDVFLAIWINICFFDESKNSFQNWICGIAKYKSIDYKRKYGKELKFSEISTLEIKDDKKCIDNISDKELSAEWESLLTCLKKEDRELFLKRYIEEIDIEELSQKAGIKKQNIYNKLSRVKTKLRNLIPESMKDGGNKL